MIDETTRKAYEIALQAALRDQARANATVEFFREKLGLADASGPTVLGPGDPERADDSIRDVGPIPVTPGEFYGMSQPVATATFLERAGRHRPQRTEAIIDALKRGGIQFGSKDPTGTFYTILNRSPQFHNVGNSTWGLAAWYPNAVKKAKKAPTTPAGTGGSDGTAATSDATSQDATEGGDTTSTDAEVTAE